MTPEFLFINNKEKLPHDYLIQRYRKYHYQNSYVKKNSKQLKQKKKGDNNTFKKLPRKSHPFRKQQQKLQQHHITVPIICYLPFTGVKKQNKELSNSSSSAQSKQKRPVPHDYLNTAWHTYRGSLLASLSAREKKGITYIYTQHITRKKKKKKFFNVAYLVDGTTAPAVASSLYPFSICLLLPPNNISTFSNFSGSHK